MAHVPAVSTTCRRNVGWWGLMDEGVVGWDWPGFVGDLGDSWRKRMIWRMQWEERITSFLPSFFLRPHQTFPTLILMMMRRRTDDVMRCHYRRMMATRMGITGPLWGWWRRRGTGKLGRENVRATNGDWMSTTRITWGHTQGKFKFNNQLTIIIVQQNYFFYRKLWNKSLGLKSQLNGRSAS